MCSQQAVFLLAGRGTYVTLPFLWVVIKPLKVYYIDAMRPLNIDLS